MQKHVRDGYVQMQYLHFSTFLNNIVFQNKLIFMFNQIC